MEAGKGSLKQNKMLTTSWDGDWESFKQKFEATADLNGLNEAVTAGQLLAEGEITWPWITAKVEMSSEVAANENLMKGATVQSHRLASMLILSLLDSTGIQKSIVGDRLRYEKDGVRTWADLVLHFEMNSKDLRVGNLTKKWDDAVLQVGEHPDKLWTELNSINRNLAKLGGEFRDSHFMRRFIAGIKAQPNHPYKQVLTLYKGSVIAGPPLKINQLRDLLSETYDDERMADSQSEENMKGFIVFKVCEVCKKKGHTKVDCWVAHPDKKPNRTSKNDRYARSDKESRLTCWSCGKPDHTKRECRARKSRDPQGIAAAIGTSPIITNKPIHLDSACLCHLMADAKYLKPSTVTETAEAVTVVVGQCEVRGYRRRNDVQGLGLGGDRYVPS